MYWFYSFITLLIGLFFLSLGLLALLLPWSEGVRFLVIGFIQENVWPWNLFGIGFVLVGLGLLAHIWLTHRHHTYVFKVGPNETSVSERVLEDYLHSYLEQRFPNQEISHSFAIKKNKLTIVLDFPFIPPDGQKILCDKVKCELSHILRETLGCHYTLEFYISFVNQRPSS